MNTYKLYTLKVSTLTPLHIGSGNELLNEYDYAVHKGQTWRLNDSAILDEQPIEADPALVTRLAQIPPAQLLKDKDFDAGKPFFRYVIKGTPRSEAGGAQLREQLKDTFDKPYLPGSSLKGALRTAVAWYGWKELKLKPERAKLSNRREWAGQNYEHDIFGADPNHDLLRALQVSDSQSVDSACLIVLNARVVNTGGTLASPVEMEAIKPDTVLECSLKLDLSLFSEWTKSKALPANRQNWLEKLPEIISARSREHIQKEEKWFAAIPDSSRITGFYQKLLNSNLADNQFLLQLGWGTGWEDKTLGSRLQVDDKFMERIITDYRLTRGKRQAGDPFPKSRRAAVSFAKGNAGKVQEIPASPMGWALVEMTKVR